MSRPRLRTRPRLATSPHRLPSRIGRSPYLKGQRARRVMLEAFSELFGRVDLVASPTVPLPAPTFEEVRSEASRGGLVRFTRRFNPIGLPACSLPCGFSSGGLPIELQLVGRPPDERMVLRATHACERQAGWSARRPPV